MVQSTQFCSNITSLLGTPPQKCFLAPKSRFFTKSPRFLTLKSQKNNIFLSRGIHRQPSNKAKCTKAGYSSYLNESCLLLQHGKCNWFSLKCWDLVCPGVRGSAWRTPAHTRRTPGAGAGARRPQHRSSGPSRDSRCQWWWYCHQDPPLHPPHWQHHPGSEKQEHYCVESGAQLQLSL